MTFCCEFWLKRRFPRHHPLSPLSPLKQVKVAETCDSMRHATREKQPSMELSSDYGSEGWGFESLQARHSLAPKIFPAAISIATSSTPSSPSLASSKAS